MAGKAMLQVWVCRLLGGLLLVGGCVWLVIDNRMVAEARGWPSVMGRVEAATLDAERRSRDGNWRTYYTPKVRYRYEVGGTAYSNNYIWLDGSHEFSTREAAMEVMNAYPPGAAVEVYYAPDDPSRSVLRREGRWGVALFIALLGALFIALVMPWRRRA